MSSSTTNAGTAAEAMSELGNLTSKKPSPEICSLMSQLSAKFETLSPSVKDHLTPCDPGYGTPVEGSETAYRGRKAHDQIAREIIELCQIITMYGDKRGKESFHMQRKKGQDLSLFEGKREEENELGTFSWQI